VKITDNGYQTSCHYSPFYQNIFLNNLLLNTATQNLPDFFVIAPQNPLRYSSDRGAAAERLEGYVAKEKERLV
jgi:hypothetical protein